MYFVLLEHSPDKKLILRTQGSYDAKGSLTKSTEKKDRLVRYANTPVKLGERDLLVLAVLLGEEKLHEFLQDLQSGNIGAFKSVLNAYGVDIVVKEEKEDIEIHVV